jgi:hypothetical protein
VRRGNTWFAVRAGPSLKRFPGDLRYDAGLVALKRRDFGDPWYDVLPLRPHTWGGADSAGPVLIRGGERAFPVGRKLGVRGGVVTLRGAYRTAGGRRLRRGARLRYAPTRCGVRVTWWARRGDRFEYSAFARAHNRRPVVSRWRISDWVQRVSARPRPGKVSVDRRVYWSATDPRLRRARMRWRVRRAGRLSVTTCRVRTG